MAADLWAVVLDTGGESGPHIYGPIVGEDAARAFAEFLTAEVDPATCHRMHDPTGELLGFWRAMEERARAWDPDVAAKAEAGAAMAYAIWYGGAEFARSMPDQLARAYIQACDAYRISHKTTPTEQPHAAEGNLT